MNDLISINIINLEHRVDRRDECVKEFEKLGEDLNFNFFPAKYVENLGARGCALSHAAALSNFLLNSKLQYLLILEDDFEIRNHKEFKQEILQIIDLNKSWDVFLLGHNQAVPIEYCEKYEYLRVINSQTASGYVVGRDYAIELIHLFFKSAELLTKSSMLPNPNAQIAHHLYCCDILWKELQIKNRFLTKIPSLIFQRKSFSDIEKKITDYNC